MREPGVRMAFPGMTLEVERQGEYIEVHTPEPDPDWRYIDAAGHGHFWTGKGKTEPGQVRTHYETLRWVPEPCTMGHGSEGHWECPDCREHIVPGTRPVGHVWIDHGAVYRLIVQEDRTTTHYQFRKPEYERLLTDLAKAAHESLADHVTKIERRG